MERETEPYETRQQHPTAHDYRGPERLRLSAKIKSRIYYRSLPLADISCVMEIKRCCQRLQQISRRALITVAKTNRKREFIAPFEVNFAGQRNVSVFSGAEFPLHWTSSVARSRVHQMRRYSFAKLKPASPKGDHSLTKQLRFYFKRFQSEIDLSNFAQIFPSLGTIWNLISGNLVPPSLTSILRKCFAVDRKLHCLVRVFVFGHRMFRWAPAMSFDFIFESHLSLDSTSHQIKS